MTSTNFSRGAVCLSIIAFAPTFRAQGPPPQQRLVFQALDLDHDGTLSAAELRVATKSLAKLDRNGDGQLTSDELTPRPEAPVGGSDQLLNQLMAFDKNGDGILTADELPARMQGMFTRGDTDHDGKLTVAEIRAMAAAQNSPSGPATRRGGAGGMMRLDPILNALDADHDGTISAQEITGATAALLALDKNGDGQLTPDETRVRQQTPEERAQHMLDEWDTNKDGKITKAEAPDRMQQQFESLDKNGDGFLTMDELVLFFKNNNGPRGPRPVGEGGGEGRSAGQGPGGERPVPPARGPSDQEVK